MSKLQTNMVIEILGRPPEHVTEAINGIVDKIGTEKGVKILERTCHEPIPVEGSKNLFTTFADIYLTKNKVNTLMTNNTTIKNNKALMVNPTLVKTAIPSP